MPQLFENELFQIAPISDSSITNLSDAQIDEKYIKGEIRIVTEQGRYPLASIKSMLDGDQYKLNPEYQRRRRWSRTQQSKLIESLIINVPIPPVFLYEYDYSQYEVMDGLQRLTAIREFYDNVFPLEGLDQWSELNGKTYNQLPEQVRKGIDRRYISSIILLKETAKTDADAQKLKQLVFERINSGGVHLSEQESRNALYPGCLNSLSIQLAENDKFKKMWSMDDSEESSIERNERYAKMEDVELVLRFFAYRHIDKWENMTLKQFLDKFLMIGNSFPDSVLSSYKILFNKTIDLLYGLYGSDAFKIMRKRGDNWILYDRPTKVIYDPLMMAISNYVESSDTLLSKKDLIQKDTYDLQKEQYQILGGRNTNKKDVIERYDILNKFFQKYI
ncbi:DUF262 domain-containing protein [uncultured Muribaculum sp.]|uniref:DUF262 domain-containing protein n=1 Tax=uncultured Muribaculum sp. TaxID=1918613 RepID=UPI00260174A3|nr:DUF262 domain-containing protein [uncultured Muribaculum sp.]